MSAYWLLLAAALLLVYSILRKRLRRQTRELHYQTSRLDEFTEENLRMRHQSDRAVDRLLKQPSDAQRRQDR